MSCFSSVNTHPCLSLNSTSRNSYLKQFPLLDNKLKSTEEKNEDLKDDVENLNELVTSKQLEINALKGELTHLESLSRGRSRASADTADSGLSEFGIWKLVHGGSCKRVGVVCLSQNLNMGLFLNALS